MNVFDVQVQLVTRDLTWTTRDALKFNALKLDQGQSHPKNSSTWLLEPIIESYNELITSIELCRFELLFVFRLQSRACSSSL